MSTLKPEDRAAYHRDMKTNKTGFLGVYFKRRDNGYEARIRVPDRKEKIYCGWAKTAEEAARMYDTKARELFGDAAVTNFTASNAVLTGPGNGECRDGSG